MAAVAPALRPYSDTSAVTVVTPPAKKERSVFSDSKLKYKTNVEAAPGAFESFLSWLSRLLFKDVSGESLRSTREIVIWSVIVISLIVVIRLLLRSRFVSLTQQKAKATAFNFTDITEDLDSVNFDARIQDAFKAGDYRLATRWRYLKILFLLDKKQLITFAAYKTNIDYRYELKDEGIRDQFMTLSRIYEYVWYGQFVTSDADYTGHETQFKALEKQLDV